MFSVSRICLAGLPLGYSETHGSSLSHAGRTSVAMRTRMKSAREGTWWWTRRETKGRHRSKWKFNREDSVATTVGRYGPSGRPWVNASSTLETNRNGVRAFRSRFRIPVDPASASLHPCADVAAQIHPFHPWVVAIFPPRIYPLRNSFPLALSAIIFRIYNQG